MNKFHLNSNRNKLHKWFYFKNSFYPWGKCISKQRQTEITFRMSPEQLSDTNVLFLFQVYQYVVKCRQNLFYWQFSPFACKTPGPASTSLHVVRTGPEIEWQTNFDIFKIQPKTIDISTRLWRIDTEFVGFYSPESRREVFCVRLNFNISKFVYWVIDRSE